METTAELCKKLIALSNKKDDLDRQLKAVKNERREVELDVLERFEKESINQIRIEGQLVHLHAQLWAGHVNKDDKSLLVEALKSHEDSEFLVAEQVNLLKLSAWARELQNQNDGDPIVPEHLVGKMEVNEVFSARVRKAP